MSQTTKQLAYSWFEEVWNKQRREAIAEMLLPDAVAHEGSDTASGPEGFYPFFDRMQSAFSNIQVTIQDTLEDGDKICVRWSCTMKHTGDGLGMRPTNKQLQTSGISILRASNGKLIEGWQNWDMLGLLEQIKTQPKAATYIAAVAG
jgi:predicted ester cyclase